MSTHITDEEAREFIDHWVAATRHLHAAFDLAPRTAKYAVGYAIQHVEGSQEEAREHATNWVQDHNHMDIEFYEAVNRPYGGNIYRAAAQSVPALANTEMRIFVIAKDEFDSTRHFRVLADFKTLSLARNHVPHNRQPPGMWLSGDVVLVVAAAPAQ